ncbi:MAG: ribbon-helix-helix protein, CopG family [Polyangia bacterium]
MTQLNINVTAEFGSALEELMRARGIRSKSEAIRTAVAEAAELAAASAPIEDFSSLIGAALEAPLNPEPRFAGHDDLWR